MPESRGDRAHVDAVLLLLDRQITDVEGRMVAKVDDLELTEATDGSITITGLLCGPAALLPRLGGRFGGAVHQFWVELGRQRRDRERPQWIDFADVAELGSEVKLRVGRDRLLVSQPDSGSGGTHRRLGDLLGMRVYDDAGQRVGRVLDARFDLSGLAEDRSAALVSLVVGKGRPGSRFGYDRRPEMGPYLLSRVLHRLQGRRGVVDVGGIRAVDWERGQVRLDASPRPLGDAASAG
jgi:sporulation protein YlmC with PRC-barrel domain